MKYSKHILTILLLLFAAAPAFAGTGGSEFVSIYDWFVGAIQGGGGRLLAILALIGVIAISALTMRVGGVGALLFVVILAAFGVSFVNSMITGIV